MMSHLEVFEQAIREFRLGVDAERFESPEAYNAALAKALWEAEARWVLRYGERGEVQAARIKVVQECEYWAGEDIGQMPDSLRTALGELAREEAVPK